ncbi:MAG TPA: TIGR00266 family protein [Candidatus Dormibacteraeota bacterium]|nr:TIGR00266 family protein [Candidatus Dormibacteraeota bacterium]
MDHRIVGSTLPVLEITLQPGERVVAEPGEFSWMSANMQLNTTTQTAGARGLFGALARAFAGGGLFMTEYTPQAGPGMIAFSAKVPGAIETLDVQPGRGYLIHRQGFLCATEGVELSIGFQRALGAGIFGGNGFVLQRLAGTCQAWVELGGEIVTYDLQPGQTLLVHPGHVGMFDESVQFDISMIPGIKNVIFGGDGLFVARLTGPGKVWLQSLTLPNLAHAIEPYIGRDQTQSAAAGGVAGVVASDMIRGFFGR